MISFFISSTFKDMRKERDILHNAVFPKLRQKVLSRGEDIQEIDLRWGVDTSRMSEEKSSRYVITSCLDTIDRCRPYIIVLIGERYGWIPEQYWPGFMQKPKPVVEEVAAPAEEVAAEAKAEGEAAAAPAAEAAPAEPAAEAAPQP